MEKKKASIGCLFWVALILLVVVIVLFNFKQIDKVVKTTGFNEFFNSLFKKNDSQQKVTRSDNKPAADVMAPQQPGEKENPPTAQPGPTSTKTAEKIVIEKPSIEVHNQQKVTANVKQEDSNPNLRNANLYFTRITNEGKISYVPVKRAVRYSDSPLRSTILTLLKGPDSQEINAGFLNLIPAKTELKSIYMRGNTAYLDFNENFRFNTLGKEGLKAQLRQIVYTCTEFINVHDVQILIDSQILDYLGPEGIYIGKPLTRDSF